MLISTWTARSLQRRGATSVIPEDPDQTMTRPRRRAAAHTTTFSTASTSGTQYGHTQQMLRQRAAGATVARTAHGTRSAHGTRARDPRVHACSSVEAAARTTHATRSAHAICVMVGVHLAASTRPRHAGRRRAGRRRATGRRRRACRRRCSTTVNAGRRTGRCSTGLRAARRKTARSRRRRSTRASACCCPPRCAGRWRRATSAR